MTSERKIFITGFAVLLVIILWMFMRVENLEKEMTSQSNYESQQRWRDQQNASRDAAAAQGRAELWDKNAE